MNIFETEQGEESLFFFIQHSLGKVKGTGDVELSEKAQEFEGLATRK